MRIRAYMAYIACLLLTLAAYAAASITPAGTLIPNRAEVTFATTNGTTQTITSNQVLVEQQLLEGLQLELDQTQLARASATVTFKHTLTNTGNAASQFVLSLQDAGTGPAAFNFASAKMFLDSNANGVLDASDPEIVSGQPVALGASSAVAVFVVGTVPASPAVGSKGSLVLKATSTIQNATSTNTDTVTIAGSDVRVQKSASVSSAKPGDMVTFTLNVRNEGGSAAEPIAITVDGTLKSYVLVRDVIPANTHLERVVSSGSATPLFHLANDSNPNNFVTSAPADVSQVDTIAFAFSAVEPGANVAASFSVAVNNVAAGNVTNTAVAEFSDASVPQQRASNAVVVQLPSLPPSVAYYTPDYGRKVSVGTVGAPLHVQGIAAACNLNPQVAERQPIKIVAQLSGDIETFQAVETGLNTGIYRIEPSVTTKDANVAAVTPGNSVLEVQHNDRLTATMECGGVAVAAGLLFDPAGVVFDSTSNAPVPGAVVTLIDVTGAGNGGQAGRAAVVLLTDGVTSAPSTVTTSADGRFEFPLVAPSTYKLNITVPNGYRVPSTVPAAQLPAGRVIHATGSFLGNFDVTVDSGAVMLDVPADPAPISGLFVQKSASKQFAQIGEFVDYTVQVANNSGVTLSSLELKDTLPRGFKYVAGSGRVKKQAAEPVLMAGNKMRFSLGMIESGSSVTVTYRVQIGASTTLGKQTNIAEVSSGRAVSNQARATIEVQGGVFSDRGFIVGNVYTKCEDNGSVKTLAVPGVRVFVEDGTYAITDLHGRYSIYGVRPQTHVLKVDGYSLPRGSRLLATNARNVRDGNTQFIDMKYGELRRGDFELACTARVREQVLQRIEVLKASDSEVMTAVKGNFSADAPQQSGTAKSVNASGVISGQAPTFSDTPNAEKSETREFVPPPGLKLYEPPVKKQAETEVVEKLLATQDESIGFANLKDKQVLPLKQTNVWVKGPSGSNFMLKANGEVIDKNHIGSMTSLPDRRIDSWLFIGVELRTGRNELSVSATDPFGNERTSKIEVIVPAETAKVRVTAPTKPIQADGLNVASVQVSASDATGVQILTETQVTLETSAGRWLVKDLDDTKPGVQTFMDGGAHTFELLAPTSAADATIRVTVNGVLGETKVSFVPELRPLTAAGVMEYELNFQGLGKSIESVNGTEGFEEQLRLFSMSDSNVQAGSRTAMYLKGKVLGENLLTFAYDSNRTSGERLFRDIQPDQFYPLYGDSSVRGYDAQSSSKMYLRIDNGKSYLLYGDFQTSDGGQARVLTNYSRSLTGVRHRYENEKTKVSSFASYDTYRQVVEEFAAIGTSGPYTFKYSNGVENSEKVELLIRDRNQQSVVLKTISQTRFFDYEFEPFTGRLLFKAPIPTLDDDMNPIYIRVTYEVEQGGERFWAGGIDGQYKLTNNLTVGAIGVADSNPEDENQLFGLNTSLKLPRNAEIRAEVANTHHDTIGSGLGYRVEYTQETQNLSATSYLGRTTEGFENTSAFLSRGRGEAGGKLKYKWKGYGVVNGEFIRTEDVTNGGTQVGAKIGIERSLWKRLEVRFELRHSQQSATASQSNVGLENPTLLQGSTIVPNSQSTYVSATPEVTPNEMTTFGLRVGTTFRKLRSAKVTAEFEQDIADAEKHRFALGATIPVGSKGRIYARHELLSSLGNTYALNDLQSRMATVIGIDTDYLKHAHLFSEVRQRDELTNRDTEAALGLRNLWQLKKGLGVSAGFESIRSFSSGERNSFAITSAVEFNTGDNARGSARVEYRNGATTDSYLTQFSYGRQITKQWTLLTRNIFLHDVTKQGQGAARNQARFQTGAAYRGSEASRWDVLSMLEYRIEDSNAAAEAGYRRSLAVFSSNFNYQPVRGMSFSGRYATKWVLDNSNGLKSDSLNQMISWHATKDLGRKFDVGLIGSVLGSGSLKDRKQGFGTELGYQLKQNLWISSGYNFLGFYEKDLPGGTDARQGAFVRLRFKFDENILKGGTRQQVKAKN